MPHHGKGYSRFAAEKTHGGAGPERMEELRDGPSKSFMMRFLRYDEFGNLETKEAERRSILDCRRWPSTQSKVSIFPGERCMSVVLISN
jgi:hypothetical protein